MQPTLNKLLHTHQITFFFQSHEHSSFSHLYIIPYALLFYFSPLKKKKITQRNQLYKARGKTEQHK